MTAWTQQEIRRFASRVQRLYAESKSGVLVLAAGRDMTSFKNKQFVALDPFVSTIPCRLAIAENEEAKTKIDLLLFGHKNSAWILWPAVKAWAHKIIVECRQETEAYKDDEDYIPLKAFNDDVIDRTQKIRRLARQRLEQHFQVDLSPIRRQRS